MGSYNPKKMHAARVLDVNESVNKGCPLNLEVQRELSGRKEARLSLEG